MVWYVLMNCSPQQDTAATRQPALNDDCLRLGEIEPPVRLAQGRNNDGNLRLGEMERSELVSHGIIQHLINQFGYIPT